MLIKTTYTLFKRDCIVNLYGHYQASVTALRINAAVAFC